MNWRFLRMCLCGLGVGLLAIFIWNISWFAKPREGGPFLIAHRGVHQTFSRDGLTNQTCTAERIFQPKHRFLESTLASMDAAFTYGADIVEIDVIRTADDDFAVFHDWTLDCRTNGVGRTTDQTMAALKRLDIGYGYTADGGATYPFRGTEEGMMPSLGEVLSMFPQRAFIINVKGNRAEDAPKLQHYLSKHAALPSLALFSGPRFASEWRVLKTGIPVNTRVDSKSCAKGYLAWGWTGHIPAICKASVLVMPLNLQWIYWGWPVKTVNRFEGEDIQVHMIGPLSGPTSGIDTLKQLQAVPKSYRGYIVTDAIEVIGPALQD